MKIYIFAILLLVVHIYGRVISQMNSMKPSELGINDDQISSSKEKLERLILKAILLEDAKLDDDESSGDDILKSELKKLLLKKRNDKMNQLKKLTVFNG